MVCIEQKAFNIGYSSKHNFKLIHRFLLCKDLKAGGLIIDVIGVFGYIFWTIVITRNNVEISYQLLGLYFLSIILLFLSSFIDCIEIGIGTVGYCIMTIGIICVS